MASSNIQTNTEYEIVPRSGKNRSSNCPDSSGSHRRRLHAPVHRNTGSVELDLRDVLPERLALYGGNRLLKLRGLTSTSRSCEGTCAPRGTAMYFIEVRQLRKRVLVTERDEDDAVVRQRRQRAQGRQFLSATRACGADEDTRVLLVQRSLSPQATCRIPERLAVIKPT